MAARHCRKIFERVARCRPANLVRTLSRGVKRFRAFHLAERRARRAYYRFTLLGAARPRCANLEEFIRPALSMDDHPKRSRRQLPENYRSHHARVGRLRI